MGATAIAIMAAIQGGIAIAPDVIKLAGAAKDFIAGLFSSGVITASEQNEMNARVTELCVARLKGELPDHWKVEADPK
jgi:hypothetical protein